MVTIQLAIQNASNILARQEIFELLVHDRKVPTVLWTPLDRMGPRPLLLVSHGGSGHKLSDLVLNIAKPMVEQHKIAVVAIDGPVHGERREKFEDGVSVRQEFRDLWSNGESVDTMIADWSAVLVQLSDRPNIDLNSVAWYGISMGTAYGIPVVAAEPLIRAALLGMWGTCRQPSKRLSMDAKKIEIPILFQMQSEDPLFSVSGQEELFGQIASSDKRLTVHHGTHTDPSGKQLEEAVNFLITHLLQ